jgi:hypothetical protein
MVDSLLQDTIGADQTGFISAASSIGSVLVTSGGEGAHELSLL